MVLKANDRRTSCPCHDEFRGPRSDYVRQVALKDNNNFQLDAILRIQLLNNSFADSKYFLYEKEFLLRYEEPKSGSVVYTIFSLQTMKLLQQWHSIIYKIGVNLSLELSFRPLCYSLNNYNSEDVCQEGPLPIYQLPSTQK
ncbi:hypothetical protein TNCV_106121 [Trichonephila clavipes]|nr:hypothetical protein TNCV_106121 [Trichonephila clavipes]